MSEGMFGRPIEQPEDDCPIPAAQRSEFYAGTHILGPSAAYADWVLSREPDIVAQEDRRLTQLHDQGEA